MTYEFTEEQLQELQDIIKDIVSKEVEDAVKRALIHVYEQELKPLQKH